LVRVRFAPSPTGALHIGGARTALYNYLFAKINNGSFILRLEDTDRSRSQADAAAGILDGLSWLGLAWDEGPDIGGNYGPYQQSLRLSVYRKVIDALLSAGQAYYCFCSPEKIQHEKEAAQAEKINYRYSGACKNLTEEERQCLLAQGLRPVVRLKVPDSGVVTVQDIIRGSVEFSNALSDDFIIVKSDGWPTYNLAVVTDDHHMKISHVIRAEEHLSNTPKQIHLYNALGWEPPQFAHVSMILSPDRGKLSKRHGATSVQEFREQGYLPQALLNYLVLLGWSSGENLDLLTVSDMLEKFSLERASASPAVYSLEKMDWLNGQYLNQLSDEALYTMLESEFIRRGWSPAYPPGYCGQVVALVRGRGKTLTQIIEAMAYFYDDFTAYDPEGAAKYFQGEGSHERLAVIKSLLENTSIFNAEELERVFRAQAQSMGIKAAALIHPARLAVSGRTATPGLFEVMELLGRERCIARAEKALAFAGGISGYN
jgi:glutamyl-tRNA synthetase